MYARRFYRQVPPGYSGVAFGGAKEGGVGLPLAEDGSLAAGQRGVHEKEKKRMAPLGTVFEGQKLAPLLSRGEESAVADKQTLAKAESSEERKPIGDKSDLVLIGTLLFLLGTGLDEESVLIMLTLLILLS